MKQLRFLYLKIAKHYIIYVILVPLMKIFILKLVLYFSIFNITVFNTTLWRLCVIPFCQSCEIRQGLHSILLQYMKFIERELSSWRFGVNLSSYYTLKPLGNLCNNNPPTGISGLQKAGITGWYVLKNLITYCSAECDWLFLKLGERNVANDITIYQELSL